MDDLVFEGQPVHLKSLQHGAPAVEQYFSFEESVRWGELAVEPAGPLRAVYAQRHEDPARFAVADGLEQPFQAEGLGAIKDRLGVAVRRVAIHKVALPRPAHGFFMFAVHEGRLPDPHVPFVHSPGKGLR